MAPNPVVTKDLQEKFKRLYEIDEESTLTIGKKFNINDVTVRKYLLLSGVKVRNKSKASEIAIKNGRAKIPVPMQHKIPRSSKKLTEEKAYVLGVLCGDGYISCYKNCGYQIALQSIDKEFVDQFSKCLYDTYKLRIKKSLIKVNRPRWNDKYQSRICSKKVFRDLQKYHKNFKTFEWRVPSQIFKSSKKIQAKFLQGFFDSEGHVSYKNKKIIGCSASFRGIIEIKKLLDCLDMKSSMIDYKGRNLKGIFIQDRKSIEIFSKKINFVIIRKRENLKKLINSYKRYHKGPKI